MCEVTLVWKRVGVGQVHELFRLLTCLRERRGVQMCKIPTANYLACRTCAAHVASTLFNRYGANIRYTWRLQSYFVCSSMPAIGRQTYGDAYHARRTTEARNLYLLKCVHRTLLGFVEPIVHSPPHKVPCAGRVSLGRWQKAVSCE